MTNIDTLLKFDPKLFMDLINDDASKVHDLETEDKFLIVRSFQKYVEGYICDLMFNYKNNLYIIGIDAVEEFIVVIHGGSRDGSDLAEAQKVLTEKTGIRALHNNNEEFDALPDDDARDAYYLENSADSHMFNEYQSELATHYNNYQVEQTLRTV